MTVFDLKLGDIVVLKPWRGDRIKRYLVTRIEDVLMADGVAACCGGWVKDARTVSRPGTGPRSSNLGEMTAESWGARPGSAPHQLHLAPRKVDETVCPPWRVNQFCRCAWARWLGDGGSPRGRSPTLPD